MIKNHIPDKKLTSCSFRGNHSINILFDNSIDYTNTPILRYCGMPIQARYYFRNSVFPRRPVTLLRQFTPHLPSEPLRKTLGILSKYAGKELVEVLREQAEIIQKSPSAWKMDLAATFLVLADLASIGWKFKTVGNTIYMVVEHNAKEALMTAEELRRLPESVGVVITDGHSAVFEKAKCYEAEPFCNVIQKKR